ncbi:MAG: hypothetical protein ACRDQU_14985 [Pseudonocardiaceae bacterium]
MVLVAGSLLLVPILVMTHHHRKEVWSWDTEQVSLSDDQVRPWALRA